MQLMHQALYPMTLAPQLPALFHLHAPVLPVPVESPPNAQFSEHCLYPSKICKNPRARKSNGSLHRFCEYHRRKANVNQKRWVRRQRSKRQTEPTEGEAHAPSQVKINEQDAGSESPTSVACVPVCPLPDLTPLEANEVSSEADTASETTSAEEEDDEHVLIELDEVAKPPLSFTDDELKVLRAILFDDAWPAVEKPETPEKPAVPTAAKRMKRVAVEKEEEEEERAPSPLPVAVRAEREAPVPPVAA